MRSVSVTGQAGSSPTASRSTGTGTPSRTGTARTARTTGSSARTSSGAGGGRASGRGFNAFKQRAKESAKKDSNLFTVDYNKKYVIAFLEPENYDTVGRHWVTIVGDDGTEREVPRNCIKGVDEQGCPLCGIGMEPKPIALFNVIDLDQPDKVLIWEVSSGIFDKIDDLATELAEIPEDKGGPLELNSDGIYAVVSKKKKETKSGKGGVTEYTVARVKERDLDEDHSLDPLTAEQFEAALAKLNTSDQIKFNTYDELAVIAAAQTD